MMTVHEIEPGAAAPEALPDRGIHPLSNDDLAAHAPDRHLVVLDAGSLAARGSVWWTRTPRTLDATIGAIGHYAAADATAGAVVLERACAVLAEAGCTMAVGPMDGNTWRRYRFITERGEAPPFFLEPDNPDEWPFHWTASGFEPLATYTSSANDDLSIEDPRSEPAREGLLRHGVTLRAFDPSRADDELRRIFTLSLTAFSRNVLYTPIDEREFMAANRALLPHVQPELILLAERTGATGSRHDPRGFPLPPSREALRRTRRSLGGGGQPEVERLELPPEGGSHEGSTLAGFMFAVPDMLQARRGEAVDTVVLKTMAVDPSCRGLGLGGVLMDDVQRAARLLGFRRAIHALMHETNRSRALSDRYAHTIRRYTLFSRPLGRP